MLHMAMVVRLAADGGGCVIVVIGLARRVPPVGSMLVFAGQCLNM